MPRPGNDRVTGGGGFTFIRPGGFAAPTTTLTQPRGKFPIMRDTTRPEIDPNPWKSALAADLRRELSRDRWGTALMAFGWVHLAFFLACQAYHDPKRLNDPRHPVLWVMELATVLGVFRLIVGPGWYKASPGVGLVVRIWATFLILSFNLATLNSLTGWDLDWFKLPWATLSTFGFATMAWLFGSRFLIPAAQMYFTGLLMVRFPAWNYLIYGASWWAALQGIGLAIRRSGRNAYALGK